MLVLRREQIEVFEQRLFEARQRLVERAIASTFPEFSAAAPAVGESSAPPGPSAEVKAIVERGIESAVKLGIDRAADWAAFIALGLALRLKPPGPSGDWISRLLNRPDTQGRTKLAMIEARLARLGATNAGLRAISERVTIARREATP